MVWSDAKLLLVDDERPFLLTLDRVLREAGYRSLTGTTDPFEAERLFDELRPDLVVVDYLMPERSGLELADALRARIPPEEFLPIVLVTGDPSAEVRRQALAAGAHDYVNKPFDWAEVVLRIGNLLRTRRLHLELAAHERELEERVRAQTEQLLADARLATMQELLSGIAHELNNPLSVILGQAMLLQLKTPDGPLRERMARLEVAADRCARILKNFVDLARPRAAERRPVALNPAVREAAELVAYRMRVDEVELDLDLDPKLPALHADPYRLGQVIVQLLGSAHRAVAATDPPRRIRVSTRHEPAAGRIVLEVSDTGAAVPDGERDRVFEPGWGGRGAGSGPGLGRGLGFCREVAAEHGGRLDLVPDGGPGATFRLELPVDAPAAASAASPRPVPRGLRVLVVDDEPPVGEVLADLLEHDGQVVERVTGGEAALERIARERFDLVVCDIRMPGLDGPELHRRVAAADPAAARRFVFTSGDTLSPAVDAFLRASGAPCLVKPFSLTDLRAAVADALAAAGS